MPQVGYASRPVAYGRHGLMAAAPPYAAQAGLEALESGGHAVDAALAVNAVLAVAQPYMCGVGGDLFALLYDAPSREVAFLLRCGARGSMNRGRPVWGGAARCAPAPGSR